MQFVNEEKRNHPSESAVRVVHSYFNPLRFRPSLTESLEIAKLTFDSFRRLGLEEVRGLTNAVSRQLLYKCGTLCIDIRIEPKPGSNHVVLMGQLVDAKTPLSGTVEISVCLVGPGSTLFETKTNQFGEFYFGFQSGKQMQLFFGIERRALVVPLPDTSTEAA